MKIKIFLSSLFILALSTSAMAKIHNGIQVTTKTTQSLLGNDQNIYVNVSYKNNSGQAVKILRWYLPDSEGNLEEAIFKVTRDGENVDYLGPHYKRPAPTGEDYITLKNNQKLNFKVELSGLYDFTQQGQYQIDLSVKNHALFLSETPAVTSKRGQLLGVKPNFSALSSDQAAYVYVTKTRSYKGKPCNPRKEDCSGDGGGDGGGSNGDVSFTGACSNSEQNSIMTALAAAQDMANSSVSYLNGNSGPRYTTWFGEHSNSRWSKVASNFDSIKDALDNKSKTFDCSCNQRYFAYVYPSQPYKVYLCKAFWSASTTGTDSKGGTIIHEMSHFNVVAGTDDIVYGQSGAMSLADSSPSDAIKNADSHEYFAENKPNLN